MNPILQIQRNARTISELHQRVHDTVRKRDKSPDHRELWRNACTDFHAQYDMLAFTGGASTARDRLRSGDTTAIEYALCFIEVRPYFFRSGYMYNDFMRVLRNCNLSPSQRDRYNRVHEAYIAYRRNRQQTQAGG